MFSLSKSVINMCNSDEKGHRRQNDMDVACFSELGRTWDFQETEVTECHLLHPKFSRQLWFQCVRYVSAQSDAENFCGRWQDILNMNLLVQIQQDLPRPPPTWSPVWDHSSSAHLAGHKNTYEDDVVLGLRAEKDGKNTVVVHSCSIKLMVSLCVHLSQGFLHLALLVATLVLCCILQMVDVSWFKTPWDDRKGSST